MGYIRNRSSAGRCSNDPGFSVVSPTFDTRNGQSEKRQVSAVNVIAREQRRSGSLPEEGLLVPARHSQRKELEPICEVPESGAAQDHDNAEKSQQYAE
jgi:hypothetical protein